MTTKKWMCAWENLSTGNIETEPSPSLRDWQDTWSKEWSGNFIIIDLATNEIVHHQNNTFRLCVWHATHKLGGAT